MTRNPTNLETLRDLDRESYLALLYLAADKREEIATLWAFNAEIGKIRDIVSEPVPGEIRLQWWREVLSGERAAEGASHPVAGALVEIIRKHNLQVEALDNLLEARIFDLYNDPMPDRETLEGYLGETRSIVFQMALQIHMGTEPENGDAAGHAGVAMGIGEILRNLAVHRRRGQVFVPADILKSAGLTASEFIAPEAPAGIERVSAAMTSLGREHLSLAEASIKDLERIHRAVFAPLALAGLIFDLADKSGADIASKPLQPSMIGLHWRLFRRSVRA